MKIGDVLIGVLVGGIAAHLYYRGFKKPTASLMTDAEIKEVIADLFFYFNI